MEKAGAGATAKEKSWHFCSPCTGMQTRDLNHKSKSQELQKKNKKTKQLFLFRDERGEQLESHHFTYYSDWVNSCKAQNGEGGWGGSLRLGSQTEQRKQSGTGEMRAVLERRVAQDKHIPLWGWHVIVRSLVRFQQGGPSPPPTGSLPAQALSLAKGVTQQQGPVSSDAI